MFFDTCSSLRCNPCLKGHFWFKYPSFLLVLFFGPLFNITIFTISFHFCSFPSYFPFFISCLILLPSPSIRSLCKWSKRILKFLVKWSGSDETNPSFFSIGLLLLLLTQSTTFLVSFPSPHLFLVFFFPLPFDPFSSGNMSGKSLQQPFSVHFLEHWNHKKHSSFPLFVVSLVSLPIFSQLAILSVRFSSNQQSNRKLAKLIILVFPSTQNVWSWFPISIFKTSSWLGPVPCL